MGDIFKFDIKKECKGIQDGWFDDDITTILQKIENDNLKYTSPTEANVFKAFTLFKPQDTKILILGQDPYPSIGRNEGRAHGLAFSFGNNAKSADSLKNIFKAIKAYKNNKNFDDLKKEDIDEIKQWKTNLETWAKNNKVLLLNTSLTYEENKKSKHQIVWKNFVKNIIMKLLTCNSEKMVVFLWGKDAQNLFFESINSIGINNNDNNLLIKNKQIIRNVLCLTTGHPTPFHDVVHKYGFSTDAPVQFKQCDDFLDKNDKEKYTWFDFPENNK